MSDGPPITYGTTHPEPRRTVDHAEAPRVPTPAAQQRLRDLVNDPTPSGDTRGSALPAPHSGARFSQRQAARKLLAGRSYQAVQAWLRGEPVPTATAEFLEHDLQRVDAREEARMVRAEADEIVIVVRR